MSSIDSPFGFASTAADVLAGVRLDGKRAIVTGGASGIGVETTRALAATGAQVTVAVRNVDAAAPVIDRLREALPDAQIAVASLDLLDLASVRRFVETWDEPLHILVNNAGVMAWPNAPGLHEWDVQFVTNHLGHFALAHGLHRHLAREGARVVSVSSSAHLASPVVFDDIHFQFRPYDPALAYAQSKTANVLFAVEAARLWQSDGVTVNALMPGAIATNLQRHVGGTRTPSDQQKTPQQGAATSVLLAASPLTEGVSGRYFADCNEAVVVDHNTHDMVSVAAYALDPANAERLWDVSLALLLAQ